MKTAPLLGLALLSALIGVPVAAQDRPLTRAKQLYEAASYSEALAVLKQESSEDDVVEAETYRALCFLALGQPREAERAFEQLVLAKPFATLDSATVSPRVVSIFNDVRTKTIPAAAKDIYQKARASFDQGDFDHAATQFQQVITLAESAPPERAEMMSELKMLATGFVRLAENSRKPPETAPAVAAVASQTPAATAAVPPVAPAPAPAASTRPPPATSTPPAARAAAATVVGRPSAIVGPIYDLSSQGVIPPAALKRYVPGWPDSSTTAWKGNFKGMLEVIVGENGAVLETRLLDAVHPVYDSLLLGATRTWRFNPATENGKPVKYRLLYPIAVSPN